VISLAAVLRMHVVEAPWVEMQMSVEVLTTHEEVIQDPAAAGEVDEAGD